MSSFSEGLAEVRAARSKRDQARSDLHELQLEALALGRAQGREGRGEGASNPAAKRALRLIEDEGTRIEGRLAAIGARRHQIQDEAAKITNVEAELVALGKQSAELGVEASALGDALGQAPRGERASIMEKLRAVQAKRAEIEVEEGRRRSALREAQARQGQAAAELQALEAERAELQQRREELEEERRRLEESAADSNLSDATRDKANAIAAAKEKLARLNDNVRSRITDLWNARTPAELIEFWDDGTPILLLPLRVETRWKTDQDRAELLVRVYPDDVAVATHEKVLTEAEVRHGRAYWEKVRGAADGEEKDLAWQALASRFGGGRSAWVALETRPSNWEAAKQDPSLGLDFPEVPLVKPDSWTEAPHSRVLPDCFVLMGWRDGELVLNEVGAAIDDILILGPAPIEDSDGDASITRDDVDQSIILGESFRWVRDFDVAVTRGMGFRVALDEVSKERGFDRLVVLGLKHSADLEDAQKLVEELLDNHHYSRSGLSLVAQGTPTNNTAGNDSGWSRDDGSDSAPVAGPALFDPVADRSIAKDGQRLADFLGIAYDPLVHVPLSGLADNAEAVAMNRALYGGTLGYYLDHMLGGVVEDEALPLIRRQFTEFVTGRGPIAAIRVGSQPYGILPTSAFSRWRAPRAHGEPVLGALVRAGQYRFEQALHDVLAHLDAAWTTKLDGLVQTGTTGDGAAHLLQVLGLHPTSAEFYQRVGYSYDYLKNLESFTWGGSNFSDVFLMAMEAQQARFVLRQLGYSETDADHRPKPVPLLLQLIWRHYHSALDPMQLIDGRPLSESNGIKPYDPATGATYVDWLIANAADADALEAQEFGTSKPGFLLYMLLHFSIVMEAGRGLHSWLGGHGIRADELVRSQKFVNIGPAPTPSTWEMFRASAMKIVPAVPLDRPLLEVLNTPSLALGAGDGVLEQRAGLESLRGLPTARLERALVEHIDTLSYRLDAWQTSLFSRRLHRQRQLDLDVEQRKTGLYLGAFGYLENARPAPEARARIAEDMLPEELRLKKDNLYREASNGGFVHAPSLNHATAAALLRNGYLTHATPDRPDALAVNLSSGRVRRAQYLLEGIRGGQSLEVLLGILFERGLHEWTTRRGTPVILDQLKPAFRAAFPIRRTRVPQAADAASGAAEIEEDHQVVDGLALAKMADPYPYGIAELAGLSNDQRDAIIAEKMAIEEALDALFDVLTAEAAYQLALGNFDRAAAVVQCIGSASVPPDVEVLRTPRGTGLAFTNRIAVQLAPTMTLNPWPAVPSTERALLEPALNNWLGTLIGDPGSIKCKVSAEAPTDLSEPMPGVPAQATIALSDLKLQPIDLVYLARSESDETGLAELEQRVRYAFARGQAVPDGAIIRISFADSGGDPGARAFGEVLPLAERLRRLIGAAKPLDARHFQSPSKDSPPPPDNPGLIDLAELHTRVSASLDAVRALFLSLQAAADAARPDGAPPAAIEDVRDALIAIAATGFGYAMPASAVGTERAQAEALVAQAHSVLARGAALGPGTDDRLSRSEPAAEGSTDMKVALLVEAAKAWLGADLSLLPRFTFLDPASVGAADAARDALLASARASGSLLPVEEWLHGAACVRPQVHSFEIVRAMADAQGTDPLDLSALQLPFRTGDSWLAAQFPETMEVVHDTVSIVQHLPQGFAAAGPQCGFLIDEWVETVPVRSEITGLTFNYNAPNSAPPQALLLAVTPEETGSWSWDDLVETILDTFRRARLRAIEPDVIQDLGGIGVLLPAVMAEFSTSRGSISLDYALAHPEIRLATEALQASVAAFAPGEE